LPRNDQPLAFLKEYKSLLEVLTDRRLAALGDAYVNFVYSLALSQRKDRPDGGKVKGAVLAEALRKAGLRKILPSRIDKHVISDAAEALAVYAWLQNLMKLEDSVEVLSKSSSLEEGLTQLFLDIKEKITLSGLFPVPC
jgi:hypothetical protein